MLMSNEEYGCKESQAYHQIRVALENHKYPSGTILTERKLSEAYKMSRTPVRDALRQLTHEGLLRFVPGKVVIVPEYTIDDILEVYDLMEILQIYAVRRCMQNIDQIPIKDLEDIIHQMQECLKTDNIDEFVKWDKSFHLFLVTNSANHRLYSTYLPLDNQSSQFKATVSEDISQARRSLAEHEGIFNAIISGNISKAENALDVHYKNIKQYHVNKLILRIR